MPRRELLLDLACLALLALVVLAFFWPLLLAGYWIPRGGGDLVSFLWPMYRFAARSLRSGTVPLWNPYLYSGAPFVADNQSGVFYPVNLVAFTLFGEPSYAVMEGLVVFHIWLAAASMFALIRTLKLGRLAALFGGLAFALSDLFVTHIGNLNLNATAAWLPLLVLLTHKTLTKQSLRWAAVGGAVLAVAALAGHGQMLLFLALTVVLYAGYRLVMEIASYRRMADSSGEMIRRGLTILGLTASIAVIGVGGAALMLLPAYQMAGHTGRSHLSYQEATQYSLPPQALVGLLAPGFYGRGQSGFWGPWKRVEVGYAGVTTLMLAVVSLLFHVSHRFSTRAVPKPHFPFTFFALLIPLAFLLAMGSYTPFYKIVYRYLPIFNQIRAPARLILLGNLGLATLAADGLSRLTEGDDQRWLTWLSLGVVLAAIVWLAAGLPQARSVPPPDRRPQAGKSVVIAGGLLILSGALAGITRRWRGGRWLLLCLLAADLIGLGSTVEIDAHDPTLGFRHDDVVSFLREDQSEFRIEDAAGAWQPDAALVHGLYDIDGIFNPLALAPYQAYRWAIGERGGTLYNLLGTKYVLVDKGKVPGDERLVPVYTVNPEIDVYLNTAALPRALFVSQAQVVEDHEAAWQAIHASEFEPTKQVVLEQRQIEGQGTQVVENAARESVGRITFNTYGLNEAELMVEASRAGWLVLSDVYYPGWRATVNDQPTDVLRANYTFRAVWLPVGEHTVRMSFSPLAWRVGLALSLVTWSTLSAWAVVTLIKRQSQYHPD